MYRVCKIVRASLQCIRQRCYDYIYIEYTSVEESQVFNSNGMWSDVTLSIPSIIYVARYKIFVEALEKKIT